MVTLYPSTETLSFCLPGQKKAAKPWEGIQILKKHIKGKIKTSCRVSTTGCLMLRNFHRYFSDWRHILFNHADNVIMRPVPTCFGIFSHSKACRLSATMERSVWVSSTLQPCCSLQTVFTDWETCCLFLFLCNNRITFICVFFPVGLF